jgi:Pirin C-terminal cupin domain
MDLGTFEIVITVALGLLAAVTLLSLLGVLLAFSLAVATPAIAGLAAPLRRRRWRDWHPPTDWLPGADETGASRRADPPGRPMRAVTLLSASEEDAQVRVIAAQVPSEESGQRARYVPMTLVHARLQPGSRIALPPDDGCDVLVYVLAGQGFVGGSHRRPVCSGQLAVLEPDAPVIAASASNGSSRGLEVLALGELPEQHPVARGEAAVRRRAAQVNRRLEGLRVAELGRRRPDPVPAQRRARRHRFVSAGALLRR